ncbi:MAG TPA: lipoprotein insertase outer membrane protein LolB [Gammaproteobacteria bacterium]
MTRSGLFLLVILLTGCAVSPIQTTMVAIDDPAWELRRTALADLQRWSLKGRMALRTDKESWTVTLHWENEVDRFQLRMIAPLGQGTWQLTGNRDLVALTTDDNQTYEAADSESLLRQTLGWEIPLEGLEYWVRGMPQPNKPFDRILLDSEARMVDLKQSGWEIKIERYQKVRGMDLPGKISMFNPHFSVKLVIQDWQT